MKKKFTFLIAAIAAILLTTIPEKTFGQASVDDILWSETWNNATTASSASNSATPSANCSSDKGTFVYNNGTVTYSQSSNSVYVRTDATPTGGSGNNLIMPASSTWTISDIPTGQATAMTLTFASNRTTFSVTSNTSGITISGSGKSWTISQSTGITSFNLTITNSGSNNARVDNTELIVKTAGSITTHTFTTAVSPAGSGSVTAKDSGDNTVASGSEVGESTSLTVTATANTGYKFTAWSDGGTNSTLSSTTANPTTFTMGNANVTLTANFAAAYAVSISGAIENGSVVADMATATAGETVTITATPAEGYDFASFTVTKASSGTVDVTTVGNVGTFTMPAEAVTVSATFTAKTTYAITTAVTPASSGTITANANAWEGKTVNVSVSPAAGYVYSSITIKKTTDESVSVPYTGNATDGFTFNMPAYPVTITATFATADIYAKYSGDLTEGDYIISSTGNMALSNTYSSNRFSGTSISPSSNQIINPANSIVWHISSSGSYWTIYDATNSKYVTGTGTKSQAGYVTTPSDNKELWTITETSSGTYRIVNNYNSSQSVNADLKWGGDYWACYAATGSVYFYKKVVTSAMTVASVGNGTITATPAGGSAIAEDGSTTVSSGTTVTLSATGEGSYVLDAWNVYKTGDESTKVTVTSNTFTMPDYGVTVNASFRLPTTFTVHYSVNGSIDPGLTQSDIEEGNSVTLRTSGDVTLPLPSGYAFAGWTENAATGELISGGTYTPTDNTTLYLVFIKSGETLGYNKVTSLENITEGTYIIVNDNYCLPSVSTGSSTAPAKSNDYKVTNASSTSTYTSVPANTEWIFTGSNTAMTITNSEGKYLYETNSNDGVRVHTTPDTWAFELNTSAPCYAMKGANNKRYCATYTSDWRSYTTKDYTNYNDGGRLYLYKKTPVYTLVKTISGPEDMTNIEKTYIITVANGGVLTLSGTNNATAANLIIEDSAQLITSNTVAATVQKSIANWNTTNWYFISSPIGDVAPSSVSGMITDNLGNTATEETATYDLYSLDITAALGWQNYRQHNFSLVKGMGYLYASKAGTTLNFTGNIQPSNTNVTVSGLNDGFNLVGNPFTCVAYLDQSYYMLVDGNTISASTTGPSNSIAPCLGVIINGTSVTFSKTKQTDGSANNGNLELTLTQAVANSNTRGEKSVQTLDNAILSFNEGSELGKFYFGQQNANIYIPMDNEEYAIVSAEAQGEMPVNFKAQRDGQYTITVNPQEVEMGYLHLIDNIAGVDVDLIANPSYSFNAKADDYESRFRLVFSANIENEIGNGNDDFAFISNGQLIVTSEGTLQIVDMMGRVLSTEIINGTSSKAINAKAGVYVLRLTNGENVKTQKIVVR